MANQGSKLPRTSTGAVPSQNDSPPQVAPTPALHTPPPPPVPGQRRIVFPRGAAPDFAPEE